MSYQLREASLADTQRLFAYRQSEPELVQFNLKGFEYGWILHAHDWGRGERVLDVGAGYSMLPAEIRKRYGCEVWAVDDFGMNSGEEFWKRGREPEHFIEGLPGVRYVLGRLGDEPLPELEAESFDVIYSASALEHVPDPSMPSVWRHMDRLLKPGGVQLHGIDIKFQADRGLTYLLMARAFDWIFPVLPWEWKVRYVRATPAAYTRLTSQILGVQAKFDAGLLSPWRMIGDPEVLTDPPESTFNRIVKDGLTNIRHKRKTALMLQFEKGKVGEGT